HFAPLPSHNVCTRFQNSTSSVRPRFSALSFWLPAKRASNAGSLAAVCTRPAICDRATGVPWARTNSSTARRARSRKSPSITTSSVDMVGGHLPLGLGKQVGADDGPHPAADQVQPEVEPLPLVRRQLIRLRAQLLELAEYPLTNLAPVAAGLGRLAH